MPMCVEYHNASLASSPMYRSLVHLGSRAKHMKKMPNCACQRNFIVRLQLISSVNVLPEGYSELFCNISEISFSPGEEGKASHHRNRSSPKEPY